MKSHLYAVAGCTLLGGMVLTTGCHQASSTTTVVTPAAAPATTVAFVTNNASDYWTICRKGTEAAQRDLKDIQVQFVMPDDQSQATQTRDVDDLLAKGVTGIAISPVDPTNETTYLNGVAAKANLITTDSDAPNTNRLCYIGTDNHAAGVMAGGLIKKVLPQGGDIMLFVGRKDAQNAHDRITGIQDALKGTQVHIIDIRTDDADHGRAKTNVADALVKYQNLACLVGIYSYNGPAIASALEDAQKVGKIKVIAFDQEQGTLDGITSGTIDATVVQDPYTFGYDSIQMLDQLSKNDKSGIPANKLKIIPTEAIDKTNIAAYVADQNKKLGKS